LNRYHINPAFALRQLSLPACALGVWVALMLGSPGSARAADRIYRCGNEYTNNVASAKQHDCKVVEGGNVTIVPGARPEAPKRAASSSSVPVVTAPAGSPRVDPSEQRARDSDARAILESELRKAEARQADLAKEYKNGEPDKLGPETRNYQKYLDRVAELKASIERNESDVAGIKRELSRLAPR
jgi:hypothetical protein